MKILRDKDKKEETPEEKELKVYKRAKNLGLASLGTGAVALGASKFLAGMNDKKKNPSSPGVDPVDAKVAKVSGIILGSAGGLLHGISAVKYRKLKKKLEKEK